MFIEWQQHDMRELGPDISGAVERTTGRGGDGVIFSRDGKRVARLLSEETYQRMMELAQLVAACPPEPIPTPGPDGTIPWEVAEPHLRNHMKRLTEAHRNLRRAE